MPRFPLFFLFVASLVMANTSPAFAKTHMHEKHTSKERVKDGIFAGRDKHHYENGEHNVEFDHEAIIGNIKDAQEFDTLSPEESKTRLYVLVKRMDINNDKYIDRQELIAWILRSFKKLAEEEAADRFEEIDQDNDDKITWKEYLLDVYDMEHEGIKKPLIDFDSYEDEENMIADDKEMFNATDFNNDGVLVLEEFVIFQNPEDHPKTRQLVYQNTMRDKDKNHDGTLDFQEYVNDSSDLDKEKLITEKERFDNDLDENKDGVLTGNEVLNWVVPNNEEIAKDEVEHLFASTDEDHDNRLSYKEILDNYETFVGSEVTDYGEHLQNIHHLGDEL